LVPDPERDPFHPTEETSAPPSGKPTPSVTIAPAASSPAAPAKAPPLLSGLALNATWIRGNRRIAMINGQFYAEGEAVKDISNKGTPYVLAQVHTDRVLMQF